MQPQLASDRSPQTSGSLIAVRNFFYVSNLLSIIRLGLTPFLFHTIIRRSHMAALVIGGLAILTDMLDGYFARRLNQRTNLGKILDPIADKAIISAVIIALILSNSSFPRWAFVLVIIRDVLIVIANIFLFHRTQIIARSDKWGKCTTFFLATALVLYALADNVLAGSGPIPPFVPFYVLCIGLMFALISVSNYGWRLLRLLQQNGTQPKKAL
jgi:CDP-diacylglycerol--glycerol-3-phosphate 3-phosphatidyltransferase